MKKVASILMIIFMSFAFVPWSVFAEESGAVTDDSESVAEEVEDGADAIGDSVATEENEGSVSLDKGQTINKVQSNEVEALTSGSGIKEQDTGKGSITWSFDDDGTLTISGSGPMEDYESASASPWYSDRANIIKIVIGEGITHIGARSFYNCANLKEIKIGNSVTSIGAWAVYNINSIEKLIVPSSVENSDR